MSALSRIFSRVSVTCYVLLVITLMSHAGDLVAGVDTVDQLVGADPATVGNECVVAGYRQPNDEGGGRFRYFPGDTRQSNSGTIFVAPSDRWVRVDDGPVDVRWFGAMPSAHGQTNDVRSRFQAALDAADEVTVPDGDYWVKVDADLGDGSWYKHSLRLHSNSRLRLSLGTRILAIPPPGADRPYCILTTLNTNGWATNVTLDGRGGSLEGYRMLSNWDKTSIGHGLIFSGADHVITNLNLKTFKTCLKINGTNIMVGKVHAEGEGNNTAAITSGRNIRIVDSTFNGCRRESENSPAVGIDVEPNREESVENLLIKGCRFEDNDSHGLYVQAGGGVPPSNVTVEDCLFQANRKHGFVVGATRDLSITKSKSQANGQMGFYLGGATNAVVRDSLSVSNRGAGLLIVLSSNVTVEGGVFKDNGTYGVTVSSARKVTLTGVKTSGNQQQDLNLGRTAEVFTR